MKEIRSLVFELSNKNLTVQHVSHYTMEIASHQHLKLANLVHGQDMLSASGEAGINSLVTLLFGFLHMDVQVLADQYKFIFIGLVEFLDSV